MILPTILSLDPVTLLTSLPVTISNAVKLLWARFVVLER